jgi:hypothetical protein
MEFNFEDLSEFARENGLNFGSEELAVLRPFIQQQINGIVNNEVASERTSFGNKIKRLKAEIAELKGE